MNKEWKVAVFFSGSGKVAHFESSLINSAGCITIWDSKTKWKC